MANLAAVFERRFDSGLFRFGYVRAIDFIVGGVYSVACGKSEHQRERTFHVIRIGCEGGGALAGTRDIQIRAFGFERDLTTFSYPGTHRFGDPIETLHFTG